MVGSFGLSVYRQRMLYRVDLQANWHSTNRKQTWKTCSRRSYSIFQYNTEQISKQKRKDAENKTQKQHEKKKICGGKKQKFT